jgi:acetyltransferase-like isoleucine patch superfamily enzyme
MSNSNNFFYRKIAAYIARYLAAQRKEKLSRIRSLPNVSIHESFSLPEHCHFNLQPGIKELIISENVDCRNFINFYLHAGASLKIGADVFLNNYCSINCLGSIEIGEHSIFGEGVKMYDHNHQYQYKGKELQVARNDFNIGKISIGRNCWIGSNVTILNNVTIGDNVIIGANCLIYKSKAELIIDEQQ